jgi:hypothetical protein
MAELGEAVAPPEFVEDAVHNNETCPWHDEGDQPPDPPEMDPQADDEDAAVGVVLKPIPANKGKTLGANMGGKDDTEIKVHYPDEAKVTPEKLQWAPHHLIPGNASLRGSNIVPYLGCEPVIKRYGSDSKIKDKQSVGYNVNCAQNGVWLPSPYALSMKNKWPTSQDAKLAYVEASIDQNGGNKQFHMSHTQYSIKVAAILDRLADKLELLTSSGKCDKADSKKSAKFDAPRALVSRLHQVSDQMKRLLTGPVWRRPMVTDDTLMAAYIEKKKMKEVVGLKGDIMPIRIGSK